MPYAFLNTYDLDPMLCEIGDGFNCHVHQLFPVLANLGGATQVVSLYSG